jgi:hypothetical protein
VVVPNPLDRLAVKVADADIVRHETRAERGRSTRL